MCPLAIVSLARQRFSVVVDHSNTAARFVLKPSHKQNQRLQPEDRMTMASMRQQGSSMRAMARMLGRSVSTISQDGELADGQLEPGDGDDSGVG